jgi:hypothetical protein
MNAALLPLYALVLAVAWWLLTDEDDYKQRRE